MNVRMNTNQVVQGSFSSNIKNNQNNKVDNKNNNGNKENKNASMNAANSYSKMIENIQEQMKKVQENEVFDDKTKKEMLKDLQKKIEEVRKLEQEEKTKKLQGKQGNKGDGEENVAENADGDKLTLSDDMMAMLKDDDKIKKLEEKDATKKEMLSEARLLKSEIEFDKSMGINPTRKEERVSEIKDRVEAMDNNELEKMTSTKTNNKGQVSNKNTKDKLNTSDNSEAKEESKEVSEDLNKELSKEINQGINEESKTTEQPLS